MTAEESYDDVEDDKDELMKGVQGPKGHIRDWIDLRKDIKALLKKNSKILPLSQLNQYLIISNFASKAFPALMQVWKSHGSGGSRE